MKEKLGNVQNENDRQKLDFYATNPKDVKEICQLLKIDVAKPLRIFEPCAGNGHIAKVLKSYGHEVITNDIVERDYELDYVVDFLNDDGLFSDVSFDLVLTNPPFKYAKDFILKSLEHAPVVVVIARLDLLESKARKEMNNKYLRHVYVHTNRAKFAKDGDDTLFEKGTAMSTAWYVYAREKTGLATVQII